MTDAQMTRGSDSKALWLESMTVLGIMKIKNSRGDLTDVSPKKEALLLTWLDGNDCRADDAGLRFKGAFTGVDDCAGLSCETGSAGLPDCFIRSLEAAPGCLLPCSGSPFRVVIATSGVALGFRFVKVRSKNCCNSESKRAFFALSSLTWNAHLQVI